MIEAVANGGVGTTGRLMAPAVVFVMTFVVVIDEDDEVLVASVATGGVNDRLDGTVLVIKAPLRRELWGGTAGATEEGVALLARIVPSAAAIRNGLASLQLQRRRDADRKG